MPTKNEKPRSKEAICIPISEQSVHESITATAALGISVAEAVNLMVNLGLSVYPSTPVAVLCDADKQLDLFEAEKLNMEGDR